MVSDYYGGRTKIWLNNTLHQMALAEAEHGSSTSVTTADARSDVASSA